jgi:hypothetical protein
VAPPPTPPSDEERRPRRETARISADSPTGAVDQQALADFVRDLNLTQEEDVFFFHQTITSASELAGFFKPNYHLMVTSDRVVAIARDKNGKISRAELPFSGILAANSEERSIALGTLGDLKFVVADPGQRVVTYSFVKREHLPAIVDYIRKRKGGFDESRIALLSQPKQSALVATYVSGPFDFTSNTSVVLTLDAHEIVARTVTWSAANAIELFRIRYRSITTVSVETAERLGKLRTLGAWALAGPLAAVFVGFGVKKKDRFLKIDFNDDTGLNVAAIFGGKDLDTVAGKILAHRREALGSTGAAGSNAASAGPAARARAETAPAAPEAQPATASPTPREDVAGLLEKLASLREKGILTDEEFQKKKGDLLSRM